MSIQEAANQTPPSVKTGLIRLFFSFLFLLNCGRLIGRCDSASRLVFNQTNGSLIRPLANQHVPIFFFSLFSNASLFKDVLKSFLFLASFSPPPLFPSHSRLLLLSSFTRLNTSAQHNSATQWMFSPIFISLQGVGGRGALVFSQFSNGIFGMS